MEDPAAFVYREGEYPRDLDLTPVFGAKSYPDLFLARPEEGGLHKAVAIELDHGGGSKLKTSLAKAALHRLSGDWPCAVEIFFVDRKFPEILGPEEERFLDFYRKKLQTERIIINRGT